MARQDKEEVPLNVEGKLDSAAKGADKDDGEDDEEAEYEWVPPDGGWGWLVLSGSVMVSLLIPGTIKTFGVILVEVLEIFNASQVAASGIPALTYFLYCSLGPLASYLSSRYSFRSVTLVGGMFAASGMILSRFATNVTHLYICYGILVGTGAGLSFPPGVFIVTSYFVRLRGLANGIAISGSALGSIILPPFLRFLLETYGYRGAVLIMGGLILNVLVGASLYEPVQQHLKRVRVDKSKKNGKQTDAMYFVENTENEKRNGDVNKPPEEKGLLENSTIYESGESPTENNIVYQYHSSPGKDQFSTEGNLDTVLKNGVSHLSLNRPIVNSESVQQISRKISTGSYRGRNPYVMGSMGQLARKTSISRPGCLPKVASTTAMTRKISITSNLSSSSFRYISTAFHGSTLVGLNHEFSSQANMKAAAAKEPRPSCFANLCGCFRRKKLETTTEHKEEGVYSKLLRDPVFIVILISNASTAIGYTNFTILLPMYAVKLGFDKNSASYLLSIVSSTDLVGRIGGSALSDWLPIQKKYYYIGGLLFSGISLVLLPHSQSYLSLGLFCAAFGLASGTYVGVTAIIMVDLLGEERLASSYGVSLFINGIVQLVGPPICGFAYDYINSYNPIITALGLALIGGSAVWLYLPLTNRSGKRDDILA